MKGFADIATCYNPCTQVQVIQSPPTAFPAHLLDTHLYTWWQSPLPARENAAITCGAEPVVPQDVVVTTVNVYFPLI